MNRKCRAVVVSLTLPSLLLLATVSANAQASPQTPPPGTTTGDILSGPIRKGDVLKVTVAGVEVLGGDYRVDTDGTITMPRVGLVTVGEKMPSDVARAIEQILIRKKFLRSPNVSVYIVGRKAREVLINGAVTTQGRQTIKENAVLSEVLEAAVPNGSADLTRVTITRGKDEIKVDYKQFRNGISNAPGNNPMLEDGDRIYVFSAVPPEGTVRLSGEVKDSTRVLVPIQQGATVGQVLQMAGGLTDLADREGIMLVRGADRIAIKYDDILKAKPNSDLVLKDRDEIVVPRREQRKQFSVAGAVRDARTFPLMSSMTLLQAIGEAGGPVDGAQQKKIEVRRKNAEGKVVSYVKNISIDKDATTEIQDGDYIFIPYGKRRDSFNILNVAGAVSALAVTFGQLRR